jgi:hypothetical protein
MSVFEYSAALIDLSSRVAFDTTVDASPAAAAETVIANITLSGAPPLASGIKIVGWAAYTVGTNGTGGTLQIRQTNIAGTVVATSGAVTRTAANLVEQTVTGFDAAPAAGRVYVLTLTVAAASAPSTVSAVLLDGLAI